MSFQQYPWDMEERVEDAIVALLKANAGRTAMIIAARTVVAAKYPLVVVEAVDSNNHSEDATFNGHRDISVKVAIATEAVNYSADLGQAELIETAREQHRAVKNAVIGVLASTVLHEELNELQPQGVVFSMASMSDQSRDVGDGQLTTEQNIDVIAIPKEI